MITATVLNTKLISQFQRKFETVKSYKYIDVKRTKQMKEKCKPKNLTLAKYDAKKQQSTKEKRPISLINHLKCNLTQQLDVTDENFTGELSLLCHSDLYKTFILHKLKSSLFVSHVS